MSIFNNTPVLVTGASGFIGKHLTLALSRENAVISTFDYKKTAWTFDVVEYIGDLRDAESVNDCLIASKPEIIFHLAAYKERSSNIIDFYSAIDTNLIGTLNLLEASRNLEGVKSIVVLGTAEEYGAATRPFTEISREQAVNAYSFSKLCTTHLCETIYNLYHLPITIVRPSVAYGPRQEGDMFLPALIQSIIRDQPFNMSPGKQTRDYIYIDDLIDVLLQVVIYYKEVSGEIINVGSGEPVVLSDLVLEVKRILNKPGLVNIGVVDYRPGDIMNYSVDISKARQLLDWSPNVSLNEGLQKTIEYYLRGDSN